MSTYSLYSNEHTNPRINAQRNLLGRTHYADDATLHFHKARILSARATSDGLLFYIIESVAIDYQNTTRGFRPVIFDLCGQVLSRPDLEHACKTRREAEKLLLAEMEKIDAVAVNLAAIANAARDSAVEYDKLRAVVEKTSAA